MKDFFLSLPKDKFPINVKFKWSYISIVSKSALTFQNGPHVWNIKIIFF